MNQETISIAEAKRTFSELLGKVAYGKKRIVITKRGKPMAFLSPSDEADSTTFQCKGWVNESDPFSFFVSFISVISFAVFLEDGQAL